MRYDATVQISTVYYQQDHEGSVTHLTDTSGNVIEKYRYDVFGTPTIYAPDNTVRTASAVSNRFLFTGREYSALFGFYEYRARAYNPTLGRFMSEDPKLFVRGIPLGKAPEDWSFDAHPDEAEFNLFRYSGNDPIDFTDPLGLETAIQIGIGTDDNPLGHIAIATTGEGVRSLGTKTPWGSNFSDYLAKQATYRNSVVYVLPTTRDQESRINKSLDAQKESNKPLPDAKKNPIAALCDNCTTRTNDALKSGDVNLGKNRLPAEVQRQLEGMVKNGQATKYNVPKDSKPNEAWKLFDKKNE